jgi:hypothetical protein
MTITKKGWLAGAMAAGALALPGLQAQAQDKEVIIGVHCDRTGAAP